MAPQWKQDKLAGYLVKLRRHMLKCVECKGARKSFTPEHICREGRLLILSAIDEFDVVISMRAKAHGRQDGCVYACPDLSKHGDAYALTAPLFSVVGITESLF